MCIYIYIHVHLYLSTYILPFSGILALPQMHPRASAEHATEKTVARLLTASGMAGLLKTTKAERPANKRATNWVTDINRNLTQVTKQEGFFVMAAEFQKEVNPTVSSLHGALFRPILEGPSTQYLRFLSPKTIPAMGFWDQRP